MDLLAIGEAMAEMERTDDPSALTEKLAEAGCGAPLRTSADDVLARLAERRDALDQLCRTTGWRLGLHHSNDPALAALMWLYHAMDRGQP